MQASAGALELPKTPMVEFDLDNQYDLTKFKGRVEKSMNEGNPLLFFTPKKKILQSQKELEEFKTKRDEQGGGAVYVTQDEANHLKKISTIVGSSIHPDTGKIIPWFMRLSGFVFLNAPISMGFLFVRN